MRSKTLVQKRSFEARRIVDSLHRLSAAAVALRELGAQAMGLAELAQARRCCSSRRSSRVCPLPFAPVRQGGERQARVVRCALLLALSVSLILAALAFLLRAAALWLGDIKRCPRCCASCPASILGASCVLNGYYYGVGRPFHPPSASLEQLVARCCAFGWFTACAAGRRPSARQFRPPRRSQAKPPD
ncbi:MAG: hypothetical protein ACLUI3_15060 [Christensenellales bacterium]